MVRPGWRWWWCRRWRRCRTDDCSDSVWSSALPQTSHWPLRRAPSAGSRPGLPGPERRGDQGEEGGGGGSASWKNGLWCQAAPETGDQVEGSSLILRLVQIAWFGFLPRFGESVERLMVAREKGKWKGEGWSPQAGWQSEGLYNRKGKRWRVEASLPPWPSLDWRRSFHTFDRHRDWQSWQWPEESIVPAAWREKLGRAAVGIALDISALTSIQAMTRLLSSRVTLNHWWVDFAAQSSTSEK